MIGVAVTDGATAIDRLAGFPERLSVRLGGVMENLGTSLRDRVRDNLAGAVLQTRSGRLAAAIDADVAAAGNGMAVSVAVGGVPYAAYQEYGFHGTESVRAHLRTIKEAFGRAVAPRPVAVRSYTRRVDYPAHSYLRSALADIAPDARAQIDGAVANA